MTTPAASPPTAKDSLPSDRIQPERSSIVLVISVYPAAVFRRNPYIEHLIGSIRTVVYQAAPFSSGSATRKVVPTPGCDSTVISPPWFRTIW